MANEKKKSPAKQKAKLGALIILLGCVAVGVVAYFIVAELFSGPIGLVFLAVMVIIGLWLWLKELKRVKHGFCPKCGVPYSYSENVSCEEVEEIDSGKEIKSVVEFECICPECNEKQTFTKSFITAYYSEKTGWVQKDLENLVKKYFFKK